MKRESTILPSGTVEGVPPIGAMPEQAALERPERTGLGHRRSGTPLRRVLRHGPGYPARLEARMAESAPEVLWLRGEASRLNRHQIAVVGARQITADYAAFTRALAVALSQSGLTVVSGLARGSDFAAYRGGLEGDGGVVAVPALGIDRLPVSIRQAHEERVTYAGVAPPSHAFNAGYALRRNDVIAALGDVLVLVAAGAKSGAWHAVRRALNEGTPVFCMESGETTPVGNRWLLRRGLARPLPVGCDCAHAVGLIRELAERSYRRAGVVKLAQQLDFLD